MDEQVQCHMAPEPMLPVLSPCTANATANAAAAAAACPARNLHHPRALLSSLWAVTYISKGWMGGGGRRLGEVEERQEDETENKRKEEE